MKIVPRRSLTRRAPLIPRQHRWWVARAAALFAAETALGLLSFRVTLPPIGAPAFWLSNGLGIAVLVRAQLRSWAWLVPTIGAAHLLVFSHDTTPLPGIALWTAGDLVEVTAAALLIRRLCGPGTTLSRLRDVLVFALAATVVGPLAGGLLAAASIAWIPGVSFGGLVETWWLTDALGTFVTAPLVLAWTGPDRARPSLRHAAQTLLTVAAVAAALHLVFGLQDSALRLLLIAFGISPLLGWAALKHGSRGASTVAAAAGFVALSRTLGGHGPFGELASLEYQLFAVQGFVALAGLGALVVAALGEERRRATEESAARLARLAESLAALSLSEERFRSLAQATAEVVGVSAADGSCEEPSPSWSAFTGQARNESLAFGWLAAVHPDDRTKVLETFAAAIDRKAAFTVDFRLRRHDGAYRHMESRAAPVLDQAGRLREWVAMDFDITSRKDAEAELARLYADAEEAIRLRDDFLSLASHELKTPLTPLSLRLQRLHRRLAAGRPIQAADVERALASLDRLTELINDLLDVSRVQAHRLALHFEPVSLSAIARATLALFEPARHELVLRAPREELLVPGDAHRLEQVIANLVDNAIKFSPEGGEVRVTLEAAGEEVRLSVRDQGIGIPASEQARLFDRSFRPRAPGPGYFPGLGLGLYITRDIVERHGGRIWLESEPGKGSTFFVALPAVRRPAVIDAEAGVPAG